MSATAHYRSRRVAYPYVEGAIEEAEVTMSDPIQMINTIVHLARGENVEDE